VRYTLFFILFSFLCISAQSAWAIAGETMENDSNSIDLPTFIPPPGGFSSGGSSSGGGGGSSVAPSAGGGGILPPTGGNGSPIGSLISGAGDVSVTLGSTGASSGDDSDTASSVVDVLTNSGAFGTSGNQSNDGFAYGDDDGYFFSADGIRNTLREQGISELIVRGWDPITKKFITIGANATTSPRTGGSIAQNKTDFGILAASVSLDDTRLGDVEVNGARMTVHYRTSGRILALIPITFTVRVDTNTALVSKAERVQLTYPWYKWLMWLTIPPIELRDAIDAAITESQKVAVDQKDAEARAFLAVISTLKAKHAEYEVGIRIIL